jgi:hypothetical protein
LSTAEPSVVDGNTLGQIDFQAPVDTAGTDAILVGASIWAEADDTFATDNNSTELVFATAASETAAEKMRITSDGKVGIGTSAPASLLDIWTGNGASTDYLVSRWGNTSTSYGYVDWQLVNPGSTASNFPRLDVQVANSTIMSWIRGGNVGIGTSAPDMPLHIYSAENNLLHLESTDQD